MTDNSSPMVFPIEDGLQTERIELPFPLIVMGVSGAGKSTVARELSFAIKAPFVEGDLLHPPENIEKMSSGIALVDEDRWPWLQMVATTLREADRGTIISCSALKKSYREYLRSHAEKPVGFLYLEGSRELLLRRMEKRKNHFMKESMLDSQLGALEPPIGEPLVFTQNSECPLADIVTQTLNWLEMQSS